MRERTCCSFSITRLSRSGTCVGREGREKEANEIIYLGRVDMTSTPVWRVSPSLY